MILFQCGRFREIQRQPLIGRMQMKVWRRLYALRLVPSAWDQNWRLSPIREKPPNLFPPKLISNLKRSNFENRTERGGPEVRRKTGLSENNRAVVPVGSPEPELEMATATGLNCPRDRPENARHW